MQTQTVTQRKSAKQVIADFADELLMRTGDPNAREKLIVIESIAFRMGWNDLYNKLRFKSKVHKLYNREPWWHE